MRYNLVGGFKMRALCTAKKRIAAAILFLGATLNAVHANDGLRAATFLLVGPTFKPNLIGEDSVVYRNVRSLDSDKSLHSISETSVSQIEPCIFETRHMQYQIKRKDTKQLVSDLWQITVSRVDFQQFGNYSLYNRVPVLIGKNNFLCESKTIFDSTVKTECDKIGSELVDSNTGQNFQESDVLRNLSILSKRGCFSEKLVTFRK